MSHFQGVLRWVMELGGAVTFDRLVDEHRKGCHKAGAFRECDAKRATFLAHRDLKRYEKIIRRIGG